MINKCTILSFFVVIKNIVVDIIGSGFLFYFNNYTRGPSLYACCAVSACFAWL